MEANQSKGGPRERAAIEALYATGFALLSEERFSDAAAVFRILLKVAPREERSWLALGECHEQAGHFEVALELYSAGTLIAGKAPRCMLGRSRLLRQLDRVDESDTALEAATELAEESGDEHVLAWIRDESAVLR